MACFAVIILSGFVSISAAKEAFELYAAVGQSLTLPLDFVGLSNRHTLRWTHNKTIVFFGQQGRVNVGKPGDISANGSLQLKNLQFSSAGAYQAVVLNPDDTLAKEWQGRLFMMSKVSKPQLTYVCDVKSGAADLNCNVAKPQGLDFSWMLNDVMLTNEIRQTLSVSLAHMKGPRGFSCSIANKVSRERSNTVHPNCRSPSPNLLCFPSKTVFAAVTGGVSVILLLIVIIIVLLIYYRRNRTQTGLREKGDVRMLSLNKQEPGSISPEYETMHPTEDPRPPSPKPSPRASYQNVSPPEAQTGNSPLQLSTVTESKQPSPMPKPRTKKSNI
ncbi:T-cell surface antigen CD2-like [Paralichthys olivaceus]|uniref:T-cell surface antigen CD2-like n=1 Tax=Paralichthys olivaceus TaxID=8255 RepID=UPI003751F82C